MPKSSSTSASLKEYLKRYESNIEEDKKKAKKKKKKVKEVKTDARGVIVVDEDPVWQKPVNLDEEEDDSADEEKPQVNEDIEVKRMKRLEQLRARRPFGVISEDGSGWVSLSENSRNSNVGDKSSDISPLRRQNKRNDTPSPSTETDWQSSKVDVDLSPPRKQQTRNDSPSPEPDMKPLSHSLADLSPPRLRRKHNQIASPEPLVEVRRRAYTSEAEDSSPPRKSRKDKSPQQSRRSDATSDLSPPRKSRKDKSPQQARRSDTTSDLSPPRKSRKDKSPQQSRRSDATSDLSPPRKLKNVTPLEKERRKTGLVSGRDIKEEISKTKEEELLRFKKLDPSVSGRGAAPVYRNKLTGDRMSKEEFLKSSEKKKEEKPKEIKLEWGKGLAQKREAEEKLIELELEKEKPFARTRDDPELDNMLKERVRWGDPMAHLVKKKSLESALPDLGNSDKMQESGFIIPQEIPSHSWIRRGLGAPPNRYGIKPGRHWDGVDRSTGFEKEAFKRMNEKQATEREAYLWSVADM